LRVLVVHQFEFCHGGRESSLMSMKRLKWQMKVDGFAGGPVSELDYMIGVRVKGWKNMPVINGCC
ncbi:MAG: hypothetical protein ACHQFX_02175, partial [Chitinophagales bacterium]